ncbi:hypothetical protein RT97_07900 [Variovorax paradoxus]|uniref:Uncharacterized protein n=1 Tax=Variovorax paradoxus TaxID=34073 RepID=A0A0D0MQ39_VARPD|nr:hypothetical protein RT97_07900 [Variovorax paradoxus]
MKSFAQLYISICLNIAPRGLVAAIKVTLDSKCDIRMKQLSKLPHKSLDNARRVFFYFLFIIFSILI